MAGPSPEQINQLIALYRQGRLSDALNLGEALERQFPDTPFLMNLMGILYAAAGRLEQALPRHEKAVQLQPAFAEAHFNLGGVLERLGRTQDAITSYENAIRIKPDFAKAYCNLGAARQELGLVEAAVSSYRKAIEIDPNLADAHNNLGFALDILKQPDEAVACCRQAIRIRPDYAEAHNNLGNALLHLGENDAATASYAEALRIAPGYAEAHRNLSDLKTFERDDPQIRQMLALVERTGIADHDKMLLCFALGKAHDDLASYGTAFGYFSEGNRLRKQELNYDRTVDADKSERVVATFSEGIAPIETGAAINDTPDKQIVFIVGMPRSGTSLVEQILASHSAVYGAGELELLDQAVRSIAWTSPALSADQLRSVRETYLPGLSHIGPAEPVVTDKMPFNFWWIGFISAALPEAKIVHVKRDARATCWSNYRHFFRNKGIGFSNDFGDLAAYYKLYNDLMTFWHEKFPGRIHDLQYEALTENQESETRRLLEHLDLEWEEQCLDFHKTERAVQTISATQVRREIYRGSSDEWRNYQDHLEPLIEMLNDY